MAPVTRARHLLPLLGLLALPAAAQESVTVASGTLVIGDGAALATAYSLDVAAGATLNASEATLAFTGADDQTFTAADAPQTVLNLSLQKTGGTVALGMDLDVTGVLTLVGGTLDPGAHTVRLAATLDGNGQIVRLAAIDGDGATGVSPAGLVFDRPHVDGPGWRMLAAPFANVPFSSLNDDFHTQGAPGADFAHGGDILFRWDPSGGESGDLYYFPVEDYASTFEPGRGYFFYAYGTEPDNGPAILPTTWDVTGREPASVAVPIAYDADDATGSFNLLGNPYAAPLDWHAVQAAGSFQAAYAVWDPPANGDAGNFAYYSTSGTATGQAGRYVSAAQGFWAEATATSPASLAFDRGWTAPTASPVFVGREAAPAVAELRFHLEGEGVEATDVVALFLDGGAVGADIYDASWFTPFSGAYVAARFVRGDGAALVFEARPPQADGQTLALDVVATQAGRYTLSWPALDRAPEGAVVLADQVTGAALNLRTASSYTFDVSAAGVSGRTASPLALAGPAAGQTAASPRFSVHIGTAVDAAPEASAPAALSLAAPAPNPARGLVRLAFTTSQPGPVALDVVDRIGRVVLAVEAADRREGEHALTLDASRLPAGLYLVRLRTGAGAVTRSLTIVR